MVHAYEEVHAFGVEVNNPSHAGGEAVYGKVDAAINPLQRSHVGADTSFSPAIFAIEVGRAEGTKLQFAVNGQGIFATEVDGSAYARGAFAL